MNASCREVLRSLPERIRWLLRPGAALMAAGETGISQARTRLGPEFWWAMLCAVAVAGLALRFRHLGERSLSLDEAIAWLQSKGSFGDVIYLTAQDNYPPLSNLLRFAAIKLFGDSEQVLRLPSAILGSATIPVLYWLGAMTGGRRAALLSAAFLAFSNFHIHYSQEARMYGVFAFTATLYAATAFYFVRSPSPRRAVLVALAGLALLYSHAYGMLDWIAIAAGIDILFLSHPVGSQRARAMWVAANATAALGFAPWAWILIQRGVVVAHSAFWIPYPSPEFVLGQLSSVADGTAAGILLISGIALALIRERPDGGLRNDVRAGPPRLAIAPDRSTIALLGWAILPIIVGVAVSVIFTPVFVGRYALGSLPAIILVGSLGLSRFTGSFPGFAAVGALCGVIFAADYSSSPHIWGEDWRAAAAALKAKLQPQDCVLIYRPWFQKPLSYYDRDRLPCLLLPNSPADVDVSKLAASRIFLVFAAADPPDTDQIVHTLNASNWSEQERFQFRGIYLSTAAKTKIPLAGDAAFRIDLREGGNGWVFANDGWSYPESWGRWTLRKQASVTLTLRRDDRPVEFSLAVRGLLSPGFAQQSVWIEANKCRVGGGELDLARDTPSLTISGVIPAACIDKGGHLALDVDTDRALAPKDIGINDDTRTLGVGVTDILIQEVVPTN